MDVDNAANILAGSILTALAIIVVAIMIVVVNNIFSKYWKPIKWTYYNELPPRFAQPEEIKVAPTLDPKWK